MIKQEFECSELTGKNNWLLLRTFIKLLWLEGQIHTSWLDMVRIYDVGRGTTEGLVAEFLDHVHELAENPTHLYYVYQEH